MRALEISTWLLYRVAFIILMILIVKAMIWLSRPSARRLWGFDHAPWIWLDHLRHFIEFIKGSSS